MQANVINLIACAVLAVSPAAAADWTTSYASLARTSYLAAEAVSPPFALLWEHESAGELSGAPLMAIGRAFLSNGKFHVWSLDLADGKVVWKHDEERSLSEVKCYNAVDGKLRWTQAVDGKMIHTPQVGQRAVYVATDAGTLFAFSQFDGKKLWSVKLAPPLTIAAADDALVVVGSGGILTALRAVDGGVVFGTDLGGLIERVPALAAEGVYAVAAGDVVAVDRAGAIRWRAGLAKPATTRLAVTKSGVLVGCADGAVRLLSRDDGGVLWDVELAGRPSTVSGAGDVVFAGTEQSTLVGMRLADGAKLWSASLQRGSVDGVALSAGKLLVVSGDWVGALIPAPAAPEALRVASSGSGGAILSWNAVEPNGSPVSAYLVFRRRGASVSRVAAVPAGELEFTQDVIPGNIGYSVSAVAANGAESERSAEVTLARGEPLIRKLAVSPVPFDPRSAPLQVSLTLRDAATVKWDVVDAEGTSLIEARTVLLAKGENVFPWDGVDSTGHAVEPGVYRVRVKAEAMNDADEHARAFPVNWVSAGTATGLPGGGGYTGPGSQPAAGGVPAIATGDGAGAGGDGGGTGGGNGVRDHGRGEGRDGAGQGKAGGKGPDK